MFLSKIHNGYWYLFYTMPNGKKNKVSCKTKLKTEALQFFKEYKGKSENTIISDNIKIDEFDDRYNATFLFPDEW